MKPLTLEETKLKEEMKERCLNKGQYIDENAKAKFDMLCHLEDFEIQYWELQKENKELKRTITESIKMIDECACYNEKDKECKCSFSSMAMTTLRKILKGEITSYHEDKGVFE